MPFGLKNAPSIFQRHMDSIFSHLDFAVVYIDDILIFSNNAIEHLKHLKIFFELAEQNNLVISEKKMVLGVEEIEFLGSTIGLGRIKLQKHIVESILKVPDNIGENIKDIRSFLGKLNHIREYIPNLAKLAGPIYAKTRLKGERKFNREDEKLVRKLKEIVKNLPPLSLPPESSYLIIQVDESLEAWGGILLSSGNLINIVKEN